VSRRESDAIRQRRAPRLALVFLQGDGLVGQRSDLICPEQSRDREPQLTFCDVDTRTDAAAAAQDIRSGRSTRSGVMADKGYIDR
jgi:hypothetical protein